MTTQFQKDHDDLQRGLRQALKGDHALTLCAKDVGHLALLQLTEIGRALRAPCLRDRNLVQFTFTEPMDEQDMRAIVRYTLKSSLHQEKHKGLSDVMGALRRLGFELPPNNTFCCEPQGTYVQFWWNGSSEGSDAREGSRTYEAKAMVPIALVVHAYGEFDPLFKGIDEDLRESLKQLLRTPVTRNHSMFTFGDTPEKPAGALDRVERAVADCLMEPLERLVAAFPDAGKVERRGDVIKFDWEDHIGPERTSPDGNRASLKRWVRSEEVPASIVIYFVLEQLSCIPGALPEGGTVLTGM